MELAEATKKEYEQAKAEVQRQIEKGRQEAQAIVTQATQVGEKLKGNRERKQPNRPKRSSTERKLNWPRNGINSSID